MLHILSQHQDLTGRGPDYELLTAILADSGTSVVTVWGPAGIGKSALLSVIAARQTERVDVVRLELGAPSGAEGVLHTWDAVSLSSLFREALRHPGLGGQPMVTALAIALRSRGPCLVVLDGVESVVDALDDVLTALLPLVTETQFLVGSQVLLARCPGYIHQLSPLSVPDSASLFAERTALSELSLDDNALLDFLSRLDGVPLAIELAAARAGELGLPTLFESGREPLALLVDPSAPGRSLRAGLESAWSKLDGPERNVLAQLSVFSGSVRPQLVEAVIDARSARPVEVLRSLVAKSLVTCRPAASQGCRQLSLSCGVRAFAAEQLATNAVERQVVLARYRATIETLSRDLQRSVWRGTHLTQVGFNDDYASLIAAVDEALAASAPWAVRVLGQAVDLFLRTGPMAWLDHCLTTAALIEDADPDDLQRVRLCLAALAQVSGRVQLAADWLATIRTPDLWVDPPEAVARFGIILAIRYQKVLGIGVRHARAALAALSAVTVDSDESVYLKLVAMSWLANAMRETCARDRQGCRPDTVSAVYLDALALAVKVSHRTFEMLLLDDFANWLASESDTDKAIVYFERAMLIAMTLDNAEVHASCALNLAESHAIMGRGGVARQYLERAKRVAERASLAHILQPIKGYLDGLPLNVGARAAAQANGVRHYRELPNLGTLAAVLQRPTVVVGDAEAASLAKPTVSRFGSSPATPAVTEKSATP